MKIQSTLALAVALLLSQYATQADQGQKYRSLSHNEKQVACQSVLADTLPNASEVCSGGVEPEGGFLQRILSGFFSESDVNKTELLLVERRLSEKGNRFQDDERNADVYTYDYRTDTLNHTIVNLGTGQVIHSEDVQGVQLPLTEKEIDRSRNIASTDTELRAALEEEYLMISGEILQSLDQLVVKAFIFHADSMPGQVNEETKFCGMHRCARLVMHTEERIALETAPIVDLSTGMVTQRRTSTQ